jgi:hypothetical protein
MVSFDPAHQAATCRVRRPFPMSLSENTQEEEERDGYGFSNEFTGSNTYRRRG